MKPTLVDQNMYLLIYPRIKGYLVPVFVMLACILVLGFVIVPQIQAWIADGQEADATRVRIAALEKNKNLLNSLDDAEVASQYQLASTALPSGIDFVGIINALLTTSGLTGVGLGDFSFAVGDLSTKSAQLSQKTVITLNISVKSDTDGTKRFLHVLSQELPLSEVSSVQLGKDSSSVTVSFDYKPTSFGTFQATTPIRSLTVQEKDLLAKLSLWQQGIIDNPGPPVATPSSTPAVSPTPSVPASASATPSPTPTKGP